LSYIDSNGLFQVSKVCKNWYILSQNNFLWKELYEKKWGSVNFVEEKIYQHYTYLVQFQKEKGKNLNEGNYNFQFFEILNLFENIRLKKSNYYYNKNECKENLQNNKKLIYNYKIIPGLWKAIFYLHNKLDLNWINKNYSIDNMISHTDSVYCLQYDDEKIISGSRDSKY